MREMKYQFDVRNVHKNSHKIQQKKTIHSVVIVLGLELNAEIFAPCVSMTPAGEHAYGIFFLRVLIKKKFVHLSTTEEFPSKNSIISKEDKWSAFKYHV